MRHRAEDAKRRAASCDDAQQKLMNLRRQEQFERLADQEDPGWSTAVQIRSPNESIHTSRNEILYDNYLRLTSQMRNVTGPSLLFGMDATHTMLALILIPAILVFAILLSSDVFSD